jgi:hypothetical protein
MTLAVKLAVRATGAIQDGPICCEPAGIRTRNQGIKSPLLYR